MFFIVTTSSMSDADFLMTVSYLWTMPHETLVTGEPHKISLKYLCVLEKIRLDIWRTCSLFCVWYCVRICGNIRYSHIQTYLVTL